MQTVRCRRWLSLLLAVILLLSTPGPLARAADDTAGHWCQEEMDTFAQLGILSGDGSGKMRPNDPVTRAEFVKLLNGVFGFQPTGTAAFNDAALGSWYSGHAAAGIRAGYLSGYPDGTFRPGNPITRQEAAKMVVFVLNESVSAGKTTFVDDSQISSWARGYVKAAAALDVLGGYPDGTFRPHNHITRAETVKLLSNAVPGIYIKAGSYSGTVDGNAVVGAAGVTLENMVIRGNLYITEGAAGSILLDNVQVDGRIIITGSTDRTVEMIDSDIERIEVKSSAENTKLIISKGTQVDTIVVEAPVEIEVQKGGHVDRIENHAAGTEISGKGTVDEIIAHQETVVDGKTYPAGSETDLNKGSSGGGSRPPYRPDPKPDPEPDPEPEPEPEPKPEPEGYVLTAAVDKRQQEITQGNRVTGRLTNNGEGVPNTAITMVIRYMGDGKAAILDQGITDSDGRFTASFHMPEGSQAGDYQVRLYAQSPAARSWTGAFTVQGQPASSDLSALMALIQQAESAHPETSREQYTSDSWAGFASALMAAKAVADDPTAPQSLANSAEAALRQTMGGLIRRADKSELEAAIAKAEALNQNNYTAESWAELEKALAAGKETMADKDISQSKVNKAAEDIRKAIDGLKDINSVNATLLLKGQAVAPDFTYRALLDAGKAFPNSGDTLIWKTTGNGTGDLTVTAVSSDNAVLSVSVEKKESAKVTGTVDTLGNAVITLKTVWGADTVEQSMAVTVVNKSTVDRLAAAISVAGEFKQSAFSPELWNQFTPVFDSAKAAYADNAAAEAALLQAAEALEAQNEKLLEASKSPVTVTVTDSTGNALPQPYRMYLGHTSQLKVKSNTSAGNVSNLSAVLAPVGDLNFEPAAGDWVDKANWNVNVYIETIGEYTLNITVHFADGKHTTVSLPVEVIEQANKDALAAAITEAGKRVQSDYTPESWTPFAAALENAKKVKAAVSTQAEIDAALEELNRTMGELKLSAALPTDWKIEWYQGKFDSTDPAPQKVTVKVGEYARQNGHFWLNVIGLSNKGQIAKVDVSYTPEAGLTNVTSMEGSESKDPYIYRWRFNGMVAQAGEITINAVVTLIDGQKKEASFVLTTGEVTPPEPPAEVDKSALKTAIDEAQKIVDAGSTGYTDKSWKALTDALTEATKVNDDPAATVEAVAKAAGSLNKAVNGLKELVDKSTLGSLISAAERMTDSSAYTKSSWSAFVNARDVAQATLDDQSATPASRFNAYSDLANAMSGLTFTAESIRAFKSFEVVPDLIILDNSIMDADWDSSGWENPLKQAGGNFIRIAIGGHNTDKTACGVEYAMYTGEFKLIRSTAKATLDDALLLQNETLVIETYSATSDSVPLARYALHMPVKDGMDRTALRKAVLEAQALADPSAEVTQALEDALAVYHDSTSTQDEINEAAEALDAALHPVEPDPGPSDEVKDIGLVYIEDAENDNAFHITGNTNAPEYKNYYFQVVAENGTASAMDSLNATLYDTDNGSYGKGIAYDDTGDIWAAITTNQTADSQGRYVVTVKLYADADSGSADVEFQVYVTDGNTPVEPEPSPAVKDIGLNYSNSYAMFSIGQDPGEYAGTYFQIVAGAYMTGLNDASTYAKTDFYMNGYATPSSSNPDSNMVDYIKQNCQDPSVPSKYIVTIKLYSNFDGTPYLENGAQVEFKVYITIK